MADCKKSLLDASGVCRFLPKYCVAELSLVERGSNSVCVFFYSCLFSYGLVLEFLKKSIDGETTRHIMATSTCPSEFEPGTSREPRIDNSLSQTIPMSTDRTGSIQVFP